MPENTSRARSRSLGSPQRQQGVPREKEEQLRSPSPTSPARAAHSYSISAVSLGRQASRTLMRPLSPLKRSLSPMSASIHLGPLGRSVGALAGMRRSRSTRSDKSNDLPDEGDVARPSHMAKSFVSLLTTASMYTGNLTELMVPDAQEETEHGEAESQDQGDSTVQSTSSTLTANQSKEEDSAPSLLPLQRRRTLFELSVEKIMDGTGSTKEQDDDLQRRAHTLYEKLRGTFDIKEDDLFIAEHSCWLLKDVLLQGHIYLTQSHLLFLAFLPKHDKNKIAMSGHLTMEGSGPRLSRTRYWAILKDHTLSLYGSSTELYFPLLTIDLRYAIRAEINGNAFRILTESRSYKFTADSTHGARSWTGLLKKHIFASGNKGECVTLKIPLHNILDIEESSIFDGAETIRIKALEGLDTFVYDDYFFMFFNSGPEAVKSISSAMDRLQSTDEIPETLQSSTAKLKIGEETEIRHTNRFKRMLHRDSSTSSTSTSDPVSISEPVSAETDSTADPMHDIVVEPIIERYITRDVEEIPDEIISEGSSASGESKYAEEEINSPSLKADFSRHPSGFLPDLKAGIGKWTPKVIKSATMMWSSNPVHYSEKNSIERGVDDEFLASPEETKAATMRFQNHFSLSTSDLLVSSYYAHLHRNIPVYGKIYLGEKEICFRSLVPGLKTKMILPYKDIENCYKEKGFKFGYHGLVIVIHGHEELFLEFGSVSARDDCECLLLKQLENSSAGTSPHGSDDQMSSSKKLEEAKIRLFEDKIHSESGFDVPIIIEEHPLLKTSVKPGKSYRFTLLTIGSRGDVQPYIALGLGLKAEGHKVRIATHSEFKDWIESHDLEFKEIAGDPTELMSLMVSHGSMNVGLLREASTKFRSWISELLLTSWDACQGTEILIESPSAMAGIHIAEALGIPYFRAFTMPWTRTRAYPHAFIVPDEKKGGSYNYLTHVLFENVFWKGISGQVNKWRKEVLNLPKTNLDLLQQNKVPFLYNISSTVFPPSVDFSEWVKVTGYWFLDEASTYEPPQALLDFIKKAKEDNKKLVYIGFGSIVVSNPKELTQAVADAVIDADVRCILNKGWSERLGGSKAVEIDLPDEVFNAGSLPHDWLFPQIDAAVHHGGSGTTGATLRAGLPTIIKPFFADQFFYANRVEDIGAGIALKKLNVKSLSKALKEATTNQRMISKAKLVSKHICEENGVSEAINVIYRELEYARDLIMNKRKLQITREEEQVIDEDDKNGLMNVGMMDLVDRYDKDVDEISEDTSQSGSGSWLLI